MEKVKNATARNNSTWVGIKLNYARRLLQGIRETHGRSKRNQELIGYLWTRKD